METPLTYAEKILEDENSVVESEKSPLTSIVLSETTPFYIPRDLAVPPSPVENISSEEVRPILVAFPQALDKSSTSTTTKTAGKNFEMIFVKKKSFIISILTFKVAAKSFQLQNQPTEKFLVKLMISNMSMFKLLLKRPWMSFALICENNYGIGTMT